MIHDSSKATGERGTSVPRFGGCRVAFSSPDASIASAPIRRLTSPARRGGFTLTEVIVAGSIIGALFLSAIPLLGHVRSVRQEADRRTIAQQEATNVMEQLAALAARGELPDAADGAISLSPASVNLPEATLEILTTNDDGPLSRPRTTVSITWMTDAGTAAAPVLLSAWFTAPEEGD